MLSDFELALLIIGSLTAYSAGFIGFICLREHNKKKHPKPRRCHFCDLYPARTDDAWCSAICADNELGLSKVKP